MELHGHNYIARYPKPGGGYRYLYPGDARGKFLHDSHERLKTQIEQGQAALGTSAKEAQQALAERRKHVEEHLDNEHEKNKKAFQLFHDILHKKKDADFSSMTKEEWERAHRHTFSHEPKFEGPVSAFKKMHVKKSMDAIDQLAELSKGQARGGAYYRRVPTGNPKRPYDYYYTKEAYERAHGPGAHVNGPEVTETRKEVEIAASIKRQIELKQLPGVMHPVMRERSNGNKAIIDIGMGQNDRIVAEGKTWAEVRDQLGEWKKPEEPTAGETHLFTQEHVSQLRPGATAGRMRIESVSPKTITTTYAGSSSIAGMHVAKKRYQFKWDGKGFQRRGEYLHADGPHRIRKSEVVMDAIDQLQKAARKKTPHPVSEAQRRWAFAAEKRGDLPEGKALEWSRRVKGQDLPSASATTSMLSDIAKCRSKERLAAKMVDAIELVGKFADFMKKEGKDQNDGNDKKNGKPPFGKKPGEGKGQQVQNGKPQPNGNKEYKTKIENPEKPGEFTFELLSEDERPEDARFVVSDETPEGAHWEMPHHSEHFEHFKQWKAARKQGLQGTEIPKELVEGAMKHSQKHHFDAGPHKAAYDDYLAHQNGDGAPKPPPSHHTMNGNGNGNGGNGSHPAMRSKDENGKGQPPIKPGQKPPQKPGQQSPQKPEEKEQMTGKMVIPADEMQDVKTYGVARSGTERPAVGPVTRTMEDNYQEIFGYMKEHTGMKSMDAIDQLETLSKAGPFIGPKGGKWADAKHTIPWKEGVTTAGKGAGKGKLFYAEQLTALQKNPPRIRTRGGASSRRMGGSGVELYVVETFSPNLKKYVAQNEFKDKAEADRDLGEWKEEHDRQIKMFQARIAGESKQASQEWLKKLGSQPAPTPKQAKEMLEQVKGPKEEKQGAEASNRWKNLSYAERFDAAKQAGWTERKSDRFAKQEWDKLSPAAQRVLSTRIVKSAGEYQQVGDTFMLRKGLYAYDDRDGKAKDLPDAYLFEYLAGFVKEAINSYDCRTKLKALTAGEDVYVRAAQEAMLMLVRQMPQDKNLLRASKKYKVTQQTIADIIKQRNFIATPSDSKPSGRDYHDPASSYFSTDWDSMSSMGVTSDNGPTGEVMVASARHPWAQGAPGVKLAKEPDARPAVPIPGNPFGDVGVLHKSKVRQLYPDQPVKANVDANCAIHGVRDLTKSQNFSNPYAKCTCKR